jgi:hypothetical protein
MSVVGQRPIASKGPASAGPFRVLALALAGAAALALPACRVGNSHTATPGLPKGMAARPRPLSPANEPGAMATSSPTGPGGTATTAAGSSRTTSTTGNRPGSPGAPPTTAAFRSVATVTDPAGDPGLQAPAYADAVALRLEDDGTSARLIVELNGAVPAKLADGESMGIGIDIYRGHKESDYQVFADGESDGWLAYYESPSGFKPFPGRFELGGSRLVFVVDWAALGGRVPGTFSTFVDWTKKANLVVSSAGEDHAPDQGAAPFNP